ncbi:MULTISPECIES: helix-turn-helix domain-containing protein [Bacillales]|nr:MULTISPECIES: helix-turn-helix transcriptional regulator [Bacillus cereus group]PED33888.1 transcriptional regulator [Bacillus cereus]PEE52091.1 transcriptional regulator [Bacillus cereus]PFL90937.1 transcriptional regulator [Bacillus cereus]PFV69432.1 transcriptional regulator [Bacillus cereus]PGS34958.1 transcriptional regulator [Bacillus cereus]
MDALKYMNFERLTQDSEDWDKAKYKGVQPIHKTKTPTGVKIILGDYLKKIGLSQRSLAELCGLSQPAINDLCENRTLQVNLGHIVRVCSVLGIGMDDIIQLVPIQESKFTESDSIYNLKRDEERRQGSAN